MPEFLRDPNKTLRLAVLLMQYENDEPHISTPDLDVGTEDEQHYPEVTLDELGDWLMQDHCGDCTNQPQPCLRCHAEHAIHKATWILDRFDTPTRFESGNP